MTHSRSKLQEQFARSSPTLTVNLPATCEVNTQPPISIPPPLVSKSQYQNINQHFIEHLHCTALRSSPSMGASASSSSSSSASSQALHEQESLAASTASLPFLRSAFSSSSSLDLPNLLSPNPNPDLNPNLSDLLPHLGPSIASLLFPSPSPSWIQFLTGFNSCCARMAASSSINLLFKVYNEACARAGRPCKLDVDSDPDKVGGEFKASDLLSLFAMCWVMERSWRVGGGEGGFEVPDLAHLVTAALGLSGEEEDDERVWDGDVEGIERSVSAQKVLMWVIGSVPGLANCLPRYVQEKIKAFAAAVDSTGVSEKNVSCVVIAL